MQKPHLRAEVVGKFDGPGDCDKLLYSPLVEKLTFRHTRVYDFSSEGDPACVEQFIRSVLVDGISQDVHLGESPAIGGSLFYLDYGMKPGALDLERETVLRYHAELEEPGFTIEKFTITQRIYVFGEAGATVPSERFVRDIVNPAIHTWNVSDCRDCA